MRIVIDVKEANFNGFRIAGWDGKRHASIHVPEESFNRVNLGDTLEITLQFIPKPALSTEMAL